MPKQGTGTEGDLDNKYRQNLLKDLGQEKHKNEQNDEIKALHAQERKLTILNQIYQIIKKRDLLGNKNSEDKLDPSESIKNLIGSKKRKV